MGAAVFTEYYLEFDLSLDESEPRVPTRLVRAEQMRTCISRDQVFAMVLACMVVAVFNLPRPTRSPKRTPPECIHVRHCQ